MHAIATEAAVAENLPIREMFLNEYRNQIQELTEQSSGTRISRLGR